MTPDEDDLPPTPREKLSKTPSWIMVGFVLGCVFAYVADRELESRRVKTSPPPPNPAPAGPVPPREPPVSRTSGGSGFSQNEVDAVFRQFAEDAVWENDITQVALWNPTTEKFSELVEVMRSGDYFYYRPLTRLTRPLISAQAEPGVPVLFTETERARAKRLEGVPAFFRSPPPKLAP